MMKRALFALALALPCFGFTDCEYFNLVPVSTTETTQPWVGTRMWIDGVERLMPGDSYNYTSTGDVVIFPFVYDSGGAWMLNLSQHVEVFCHDYDADPEQSQLTEVYFFEKFDYQAAASAGELRSDGLWVMGDVTDLTSFAWYCHSGFDLETVTYTWTVWGRDYSWNEASATGTIVYVP